MFFKDGLRYFQSENVLPNDEELGWFRIFSFIKSQFIGYKSKPISHVTYDMLHMWCIIFNQSWNWNLWISFRWRKWRTVGRNRRKTQIWRIWWNVRCGRTFWWNENTNITSWDECSTTGIFDSDFLLFERLFAGQVGLVQSFHLGWWTWRIHMGQAIFDDIRYISCSLWPRR